MTKNERLKAIAIQAVRNYHSDTTVSKSTTAAGLDEIASEAQDLASATREDIRHEERNNQ